MKFRASYYFALALSTFAIATPVLARETVFVTADNLNGTNLFGTLNLETGQFTEIAQTTPLFYALAAGPDGRLYGADINTGTLFTISDRGVIRPYGTITAPGYQFISQGGYGFNGLVYRGWKDDFLAVNVDPQDVSLYVIGSHGRKQKDLGVIEGPDTGIFFSGDIAFGPQGKLYFDFVTNEGPTQLYTIDEATGAPRPVGHGLGTDALVLFSDGARLYGIDADATSQIGIYVIDTKTGVARATGVTVSGLPSSNDFYVDTAAVAGGCDAAKGR